VEYVSAKEGDGSREYKRVRNASDDGIFQNVETNIANPRSLVGMGHLDYDWQRLTLISTAP